MLFTNRYYDNINNTSYGCRNLHLKSAIFDKNTWINLLGLALLLYTAQLGEDLMKVDAFSAT